MSSVFFLTIRRVLPIALCCGVALPAATATAEYIPTNLDLALRTADQAVNEALDSLDTTRGDVNWERPILIVADAGDDANWAVEHSLTSGLLKRGFRVLTDSTAAADAARLSFRIVDLDVTGWSGLTGGTVKRRCRLTLGVTLATAGALLWQYEATAEIRDSIPKSRVEVLENSTYVFADTELEQQTWGKFVEPAIVSTVIGTLVYLFFSNR